MSWESPIIRVSTGRLNTVNDALIGGVSGGAGGFSKFGGQLGKAVWLDAAQIAGMFDPAVGTLHGGGYRYVRRRAADTGAIVRGQLLYWDQTAGVAASAFQVTNLATTTTLNYASIAGFALNDITAGNYAFIQFAGLATGLYVASITGTAAIGRTVFASVATAGRIDIRDDLVTTAGAALLQNFLGWAVALPVNDTVGLIEIARAFTTRQ
jgi:hypothetical protein